MRISPDAGCFTGTSLMVHGAPGLSMTTARQNEGMIGDMVVVVVVVMRCGVFGCGEVKERIVWIGARKVQRNLGRYVSFYLLPLDLTLIYLRIPRLLPSTT